MGNLGWREDLRAVIGEGLRKGAMERHEAWARSHGVSEAFVSSDGCGWLQFV
jgi:hypothetical protein